MDRDLVELLPDQRTPADSAAPALPIETPLVRAVRGYEALKMQCDLVLMLLEHCPRQHDQINAALNEAVTRINAANNACWHFQAIRSCEGQA